MAENKAYHRYFKKLRSKHSGYSEVVGGDFEQMGYLQCCLAQYAGLEKQQSVVEVGCGTGRLAVHLNELGVNNYRGYDIVKGMLKVAKKQVNNPSFDFGLIYKEHIKIPCSTVDFVCFYSIITHIPHDAAFRYLLSAMRILKPGGRLLFTFLSYDCEWHWPLFAYVVGNRGSEPTNQLMSHSQIRLWSRRLDAKLVELNDGDQPFFPIDRDVTLVSGVKMQELGMLGQSVCILEKPENWNPDPGFGS